MPPLCRWKAFQYPISSSPGCQSSFLHPWGSQAETTSVWCSFRQHLWSSWGSVPAEFRLFYIPTGCRRLFSLSGANHIFSPLTSVQITRLLHPSVCVQISSPFFGNSPGRRCHGPLSPLPAIVLQGKDTSPQDFAAARQSPHKPFSLPSCLHAIPKRPQNKLYHIKKRHKRHENATAGSANHCYSTHGWVLPHCATSFQYC